MTAEYFVAVLKRFLRVGISGGLAQMIVMCSQPHVETLSDLNQWFLVLTVAFTTGFIGALDKLLRFDPVRALSNDEPKEENPK